MCLHRLALRIARERAGGNLRQHLAHFRRARQRVLVEVQPQRIAVAKRRVILLHRLHARARRRRHAVMSDSATGPPRFQSHANGLRVAA